MSGHIKLGSVGSLRDYSLKALGPDSIAWSRGPADPFAGTVNTSGEYDRIDIWSEYPQTDWQAGVGRVDPTAGGFLYSEVETRVPNQLILPPLVQVADKRILNNTKQDCRYMPDSVAGTIVVGSGSYTRVAMAIGTPSGYTAFSFNVAFYASIEDGESATISLYSNSTTASVHSLPLLLSSVEGKPNASLASNTVDGMNPDKNFYWYGVSLAIVPSASTQYWVTIEPTVPTDTIEIAYGTSGYNALAQSYSGSTWSTITGKYLLFMTDTHRTPSMTDGDDGWFIRFNSELYHVADEGLYKFDSTNNCFTTVGTITGSGNVTSVEVFGPKLYFGRGTSNYTTMNTSEVFAGGGTTGTLFLEFKGLLYRAYQNDLYYSADGTTWSSAYTVGGDSAEIRGMAGMGDSLYLATDKALYRFAPGNVVEETTRFGAEESINGVGMIEYQGKLYIPSAGRIFRFDPSGQMMDVWINRDDDLPFMRLGRIASLTRMNNWLVAYVLPTEADCHPTLWMYQDEGWHFVATGVSGPNVAITELYSAYYDRGTSRLWFAYAGVWPMYVQIEDYALNPFNSDTYKYQPFGWIEQDRFYGGLHFLDKDFDGVTIAGDNLSSGVCALVYFQDESSTDWELFGTIDSDGEELRWTPPYTTRPSGKWIRLAVLLKTNDGGSTPRVRAIVLKYMALVMARITDTVTITLQSFVEGPDDNPDSYTLAQQLAHLQGLINPTVTPTPIIYQDPLGVQYEVKIVTYSPGIVTFSWEAGAAAVKQMEFTLVLRQVTDTAYA